ncbi:TPA: P-loop NTPase fold protein [Aeromonas veronii]
MSQNKIKLLNESVAQEDSYKNCTHQKIADSLYDIIESDNDAITIGLEGEWGTGKSTVINFLENKFDSKKNNKTLFFKFDAWSHDGDPLRITFLSCLINKIKKELSNYSQKSDLETKLTSLYTEVTGKIKKTKSNNIKSSTLFGKLLATSIVLVPIGSALFSKTYDLGPRFIPFEILNDLISSEKSFNYESYVESFSLYPTLSSLLLFAPIIFIISWILRGERLDPKHNKWEFISSQSEEIVEQNIIEMGDKTSFEFESIFTQIIDSVVGDGKPFSKLICVIDNMDRISNEHAKNIWSTLQVFITNNHPNSTSVWFIIPFDESAFKKIWPSTQPDNDFISNSFTEKCFQLVIDVPTPITSDWIHYLTKMAKDAFKNWDTPDLADTFIRQYKDYYSVINHSPTPRSINNIINQVQALQIRFSNDNKITINAITIYAILRRTKTRNEIKNMILYPQKSGVNESVLKRVKLFQRELSSIIFHVPYERGLELLLEEEIGKIITSGNHDEYKRLAPLQKENGDAFWQAWDYNYQLPDSRNHTTREDIDKSAIFLHIASNYFVDEKNRESLKTYINNIKESFSIDIKILIKDYGFQQSHDYIKNLMTFTTINTDDTEFVKNEISSSINRYVFDVALKANANYTPKEKPIELNLVKGLIDLLKIQSITCDAINSLSMFSIWCSLQNDCNLEIPEILPEESSFKDISSEFFSGDYLKTQVMEKMLAMAKINPEWGGWDEAIIKICNWAKRPNNQIHLHSSSYHTARSTDKHSQLFSMLYTLYCNASSRVKDEISALVSSNDFISGLYYEFTENETNDGLIKLLRRLIDDTEFCPQQHIVDIINKHSTTNDTTCTDEV